MGDTMSHHERVERDIEKFKRSIDEGPDLKVNQSIMMYSSVTSTESLRQHYKKKQMEIGDCAADWLKNLAEKATAFSSSPGLAGLAALAASVLIDLYKFSSPQESVQEALRSTLAEEKPFEVWSLIAEFLKRDRMYIDEERKMINEMEHIEKQLSVALTKLKNSMVNKHVTNQAVKIWVNGAGFHIQILIHLEGLMRTKKCDPMKRLIDVYKEDLDAVFEMHKEMIKGKCTLVGRFRKKLRNEENVEYAIGEGGYDRYFEAYYDERYGKQKREIENHFSEVEENLDDLICRRGFYELGGQTN